MLLHQSNLSCNKLQGNLPDVSCLMQMLTRTVCLSKDNFSLIVCLVQALRAACISNSLFSNWVQVRAMQGDAASVGEASGGAV